MKYKIGNYTEEIEKTKEKELTLVTRIHSDEAFTLCGIDGKNRIWSILSLYSDGTGYLHPNIDISVGLKLDENGRLFLINKNIYTDGNFTLKEKI